ncbi:MAG: helix-turn-helix transcriptional regulator [Oscillospiraceae bacterium]|nr:helix-turn-helix transcriptional regulator [Oscillospiraceae bacterium]
MPSRPAAGEHAIPSPAVLQKLELSARFADGCYETNLPGEAVSPHSHSFHEVVYAISGGTDFQMAGERYHLLQGDILSVPTGVIHSLSVSEALPEPARRYSLRLSPEFIQLISSLFFNDLGLDLEQPFLLHTTGTAWEHIGDYFRRCVQETEQRHFRWEAVVFGIATELSVQIARCWQGNLGEDTPELLDRIMSHVEVHLAEKITLPDVAARFWVSQSTISQLFRRKMGISFYRYVTLRRLTEAKALIKTGIPMDQVSIAVGFQDYSTFYRAFKAEFGISPAQYRKMH